MTSGVVDLGEVARRLADRRQGRTEANVQSDLHLLLRAAPLALSDDDLADITLESPAGQRRRIDVEVGLTVFEVKRDLRVGNVRPEAVEQLAGYVTARTDALQQRYVGVLTDGAEWHLYHLRDGQLAHVSSFELNGGALAVEGLCVWLEGVLATAEQIQPTPREIERRLGAASPSHALDSTELADLYRHNAARPSVRLKRELWAKLLMTAWGTNFADEDSLFVEHTLLVVSAKLIGHAIVGWDITDQALVPATLLAGALFAQAQIGGVVEEDFFDWVTESPGGDRWVRTLARRLARFAWNAVEHDVMKVLYESVIATTQRHSLGEYYTPDWLAAEIVEQAVSEPLTQRVLDPGCGSGTFLFHAVRRYLSAAREAGLPDSEALTGACRHVLGVDVHPVAVTFARVTYLLAIGMERLQAADRPPFSVPVYLGDSVQWGQQRTLFTADALTVSTNDGAQLFADELSFPDALIADAGTFDRLVAELADRATDRVAGSPPPPLSATFRRFGVAPEDRDVLSQTFATMCALHDQGRDHIWGYFVRNLARPAWLARSENRVDVLVGNPPWLAYRYMTRAMQAAFREFSAERNMWAGAAVATHQDLSGLFAARCIELYLRTGGNFGFVVPLAVLSRKQFAGFRSGDWPAHAEPITVTFDDAWDLHLVKPSFFSVPAAVVFGIRTTARATSLAELAIEEWSGRIALPNASRDQARQTLRRSRRAVAPSTRGPVSPYGARFANGATIFPRMLLVVEPAPPTASPLGTGAGRRAVRSRRTKLEKKPWRDLPGLEGVVETEFVRSMHVGDTILSFRALDPLLAIVPWDGRLLHGGHERLDLYSGLADWWRRAEGIWLEHRSSTRLSLIERIDYRHGLSGQFPAMSHRVVYSASGMYLAAAVITDPRIVIEHKLYWATASSLDEARYLTAVLNSTALGAMVRPLQARGEHNPRDFDKYIWTLPIPIFDKVQALHRDLASLALRAEGVAGGVELPAGVRFETWRRRIREALNADGVAAELDVAVRDLLS